MNDDLMREAREILAKPTCSVDEFAKIFEISRNPAYDAVKRGDVPSVRFNGRIRLPTAPLRQMLGLAAQP
jgi:hypothetical protein